MTVQRIIPGVFNPVIFAGILLKMHGVPVDEASFETLSKRSALMPTDTVESENELSLFQLLCKLSGLKLAIVVDNGKFYCLEFNQQSKDQICKTW